MTVRTTTEGAEAVSALFMDMGIAGAMIEDKADIEINQRPSGFWDILDESLKSAMEDDVKVTVYIPADERAGDTAAEARRRLQELGAMETGLDLGKLTLELGEQDDEDWAESWKASYKPFRLGRRFVIKPTWEAFDPEPDDKIIQIDPGMAFGSGTHETTGMCTELIERYVRPGQRVCDVGTGTGILAIAAALMGARPVLASDIDPMAVRVARENVALNGLGGVVDVRQGDLLAAVDAPCDVLIANIIADVIVMMAPDALTRVVPGGLFICSGIATGRRAEVVEALTRAGFADIDGLTRGEWVALTARRPEV